MATPYIAVPFWVEELLTEEMGIKITPKRQHSYNGEVFDPANAEGSVEPSELRPADADRHFAEEVLANTDENTYADILRALEIMGEDY